MDIRVVQEGELYRVHVNGKPIREPMSKVEAQELAEFVRSAGEGDDLVGLQSATERL